MKVHDAPTSDAKRENGKRVWEALERYKGKEFRGEVEILIGFKKELAKLAAIREKKKRVGQLEQELRNLQKSV